eukprot:s4664_g1.t1
MVLSRALGTSDSAAAVAPRLVQLILPLVACGCFLGLLAFAALALRWILIALLVLGAAARWLLRTFSLPPSSLSGVVSLCDRAFTGPIDFFWGRPIIGHHSVSALQWEQIESSRYQPMRAGATRSQVRAQSVGHTVFTFAFVILVTLLNLFSVWGEGSTDIMVSGGAVATAKQHEVEPEQISGSYCYATLPKSARKRSYLRAARRAQRIHSDATSREVKYLEDFPLYGITGARHVPLLTSVIRHWIPSTSKPTSTGWSHKQRLALYTEWMRNDDHSAAMQHDVQCKIHQISVSDSPLDALHAALNSYPTVSSVDPAPQPVHLFDLTPFQAFRYHGQALRHLVGTTLSSMFKAWYHVSQQCSARRLMNTTAKQARQAKLQAIFDRAHEADIAKDHFRLYQAVRQLAPKMQHRRISLRHSDGTLATPAQAADILHNWYTQLYADQALGASSFPCAWPFTEDELCQGFLRLPMMKSLAPDYAPAPFWVMGAADIAHFLQPFLEQWLPAQRLPQAWSRGHLVLLPKPGRACQKPSDLRPISLLEPVGKVVLGLIAQHLLHDTWHILRTLPQYAYLPGRGCTDAIFRVQAHCKAIRTSLQHFRYRIHSSAAGIHCPSLLGGLLVSLDMSRAFDEVCRAPLFECLHQMGVAAAVIDTLFQVYSHTTMTFQYKGESREFPTFKGIRQGCKGAPILWCLFTAQLMTHLSSLCSWDHILECLTAFADDFCHHQSFDSLSAFELALCRVGHLMDCLEDHGMVLNTEKTVAMCRYVGRQATQLMKKHVLRTQTGTYLRIPRRNKTYTSIKLVSEYTYLGVKISYGNHEWFTLHHRLKAGERTQQQLHKWLHLRCGLRPHQRVKIWRQCVFSSMVHGLIHTGFDKRELMAFHRKCMQQLRRIFHEPVYITRENHTDFLVRHRLPEPLQLLRRLCVKTAQRESQRRSRLAVDDILHLHAPLPIDALLQAIDGLLLTVDSFSLTQASSCDFVCDLCDQQFASLGALRRHQTRSHDTRPGPKRPVTSTDAHQGLPTCAHCLTRFTTWASFRHHIQFVCASLPQEGALADHEHRLRVTEFMHYSNAANFQALLDRHELMAYMSTHCILCGNYQLTTRGMLLHWTTEHADLFNKHGPAMQLLHEQYACTSPCALCGTSYKRTHHCVILTQIALHQTQHRDAVGAPVDALHRCPHCPKAYVTKHGLRQHMDRYHRALTVTASASAINDEVAYQCVLQAVESDDVRGLLTNPEILEFLGTRCALCRKSFKPRQYLTRHLRHHHAQLWLDAEPHAIALHNVWRDRDQCWCHPPLTSKHVCLVFSQFCMLQQHARPTETAEFVRGIAGSQIPIGAGPLATPQQHINALLFFGELEQLYQRPDLRLMLTTHCQFCSQTFTEDTLLQAHLWERHVSIYRDSDVVNRYLLMTLFGRSGCLCNPGPHPGSPEHCCVSIRQIAMLFVLSGQPLLIPYPYKAQEIQDILTPLMDPTHTMEITFALQARRFGRLWRHRALKQMLRRYCLICQAPLDMDELQSHLLQAHQMDVGRFQMHMSQLTQVLIPQHGAGDCCDWCLVHLALDADSGSSDSNLRNHLQTCPVVLQLAILLGHPAWDFEMADEFAWPSEEQRLASHRRRELRLRQFYAPPSALPYSTYLFLARCGLMLIADPWMMHRVQHTCLSCGKLFFSPRPFLEHLMREHNFHQLDTELCHMYLLSMQCSNPCAYCGSDDHLPSLGRRCPALFNLAVALCHGDLVSSGQRCYDGCSTRHLEKFAQHGADDGVGLDSAQGGASAQQKAQSSSGSKIHPFFTSRLFTGSPAQSGSAVDPARGHDPGANVSAAVHTALWPGTGQYHPHLDGTQQSLAPIEGEECAAPAPSCHLNDAGPPGTTSEVRKGSADRCLDPRLPQVPYRGQQSADAISSMELQGQLPAADLGQSFVHSTGGQECAKHHSTDGGAQHNASLPLPQEAGDGKDDSPMAVDGEPSARPRTVALPEGDVLARFLAAHPSAHKASDGAAFTTGSGHPSDASGRKLIRLMLNPTGTLCFVNATLQGLAWMTLWCHALDVKEWDRGFELMTLVTQWTAMPLNVLHSPELHAVLFQPWGPGSLQRQQDMLDFIYHLLMNMRPHFLGCEWKPQLSTLNLLEGTRHADEKGLCRALTKACPALCFAIDRAIDLPGPPYTRKSLQQIELSDGVISMPVFANDASVVFHPFRIVAVTFHIGLQPASGHYRSALFNGTQWYLYDDGKLPDIHTTLPADVLQQLNFVWLIDADRTDAVAESSGASRPGPYERSSAG